MRLLLACLVLTLSTGCAARVYEANGFPFNMDGAQQAAIPNNAKLIRVAGILYRRLTGPALRRAVVGNRIFLDQSVVLDSGTSHGDGAWFAADGHSYYWSRFRLGHGQGTYTVQHDRVCTSGTAERCFSLFRSGDGRFVRHGPGLYAPSLITIRPIPADWVPRIQPQ
jgi:hypothetical protein